MCHVKRLVHTLEKASANTNRIFEICFLTRTHRRIMAYLHVTVNNKSLGKSSPIFVYVHSNDYFQYLICQSPEVLLDKHD